MKKEIKYLIMMALAAITIFGIVTGKYLFLVLMFPLGTLFGRKNSKNDS
jgi:uncharacterized protein YqhQ